MATLNTELSTAEPVLLDLVVRVVVAVRMSKAYGTLESQMKAAEYAFWKTMNEIWWTLGQLWPILSVPLWFAVMIWSIIALSVLFAAWTILWTRDYHVVNRDYLEWNKTTSKWQTGTCKEVRPGSGP